MVQQTTIFFGEIVHLATEYSYSGEETNSGLGGPGPRKFFFFFLLDYEEKINRPPQHYTAGPPHPFLTHSPSPQSKIRNTIKFLKKNYLFYFQAKKIK